MRKIVFLTIMLVLSLLVKSQEVPTVGINDWNATKHSNFIQSTSSATGVPNQNFSWFWGINMGHITNYSSININNPAYNYGAQIAVGINGLDTGIPYMFVRSKNVFGKGEWARVLTDKGDQVVAGNLILTGSDLVIKYADRGVDGKIGGRALVHDGNNNLTINYNGDFTGGVNIQGSSVNISGKLNMNSGRIHLSTAETVNEMAQSYLEYGGHYLNIRTPEGVWAHNIVAIKPGGCTNEKLTSSLILYDALAIGQYTQKVQINSTGYSYFNGGDVGIGTTSPQAKLDVRGTIIAEKLEVKITNGADFVFEKDYTLRSLSEVESFINENKHLPEIQSEKEMFESGLDVNEFQIKLLQKIEELTLYAIKREKLVKELQERLEKLETDK